MGRQTSLLFLLLIFLGGIAEIYTSGRRWYVSDTGLDVDSCGSVNHPCKYLNPTVLKASNADTIVLNSTCRPQTCIGTYRNLSISKDITFLGNGFGSGLAASVIDDYILLLIGQHSVPITVTFRDMGLQNIVIRFQNVNLVFKNSQLINVSTAAGPPSRCHHANISVTDVSWRCFAECDVHSDPECSTNTILTMMCQNAYINIYNSLFYDNQILALGSNHVGLRVHNGTFGKLLSHETGIGGIRVILPETSGIVNISNSVFSNHIHYEPILSAISIEEAALRILVERPKDLNTTNNTEKNVVVSVENSKLSNNERAFSVTGPLKTLHIKNCTFENNVAMHSGPAMRVATSNDTMIHVTDCVFKNNGAGQETMSAQMQSRGSFTIDRAAGQVHINSDQIKGIQDMVGKGGAIRVQKGDISISRCTFINNTASQLGGAIYVHANSTAIINQCYFENSDINYHPIQGDVIYSTGYVEMKEVNVRVKTAKDYIAILRHSGTPWSMYVSSLWFECPVGMRLLVVNNSAFQIVPEHGLMRSHKLDHMAYFCKTCGNHYYSLQRGTLNFTLLNNSTDYFTLRVDQKQPFQTHNAIYHYGNITCEKCPYGGACDAETGLSALTNFWGYEYDTKMIFQRCPSGYCCSSAHCKPFNSCADRRVGVMCGRCAENHSMALFSSNCVPNEICNDYWFAIIAFATGIIYFLFLVFQQDIRVCLFESGGVRSNFKDLKQKRISVRYVVKESGEEMSELRSLKDSTESSPKETREETTVYSNGNQNTRSPAKEENKESSDEESNNASSSGFLIILFYYFQDALLLHVHTIYTRSETKLQRQLKALLLSLFRFRLDVSQFLNDICFLPNMQPVQNLIVKSVFVPYVLVVFAISYVCLETWAKIGLQPRLGATENKKSRFYDNISTRLASGFILAMMFTYQKMATATFALLNCVPVENRTVLFIDGNITCFQNWQYAVMVYAFTCVVPFSLVLMIGPSLLQRNQISVKSFFCACLIPLPALIFWIPQWLRAWLKQLTRKKNSKQEEKLVRLTKEASTVVDILQGPFREIVSAQRLGYLCWSGVLIGRRLILFLCFTFINDILIRLLCMSGVCFLILLHHLYVQPYKSPMGNLSGALSAAALIVVAGINLVRAGFEAAEYIPQGPYTALMHVFEDIENSFVLWVPLGGMCLIIMVLLVRLLMLLINRIVTWCSSMQSPNQHMACNGQVAL